MAAIGGDPAVDGVHRLVLEMYDALSRGDVGWFAAHSDRTADSVHVGVADAFWVLGDSLVEKLRPGIADELTTWTPGDLVIGVWGNTAVVVDRPVVGFDDGSTLGCRATTVFARRGPDAEWRLVHTHMSIGEE